MTLQDHDPMFAYDLVLFGLAGWTDHRGSAHGTLVRLNSGQDSEPTRLRVVI